MPERKTSSVKKPRRSDGLNADFTPAALQLDTSDDSDSDLEDKTGTPDRGT